MTKALGDFFRVRDSELHGRAEVVLKAMTGNANYPGSETVVAALAEEQRAYSHALSKATYGGRDDKALKNSYKKKVVVAMRKVCSFVNHFTPGDRIKLSSTGFR